MKRTTNGYIVYFKIAEMLKRNGYAKGSPMSIIKYDSDFVYDGDPDHPESHRKGDIFISEFYFKNSPSEPQQYELPQILDVIEWLQDKFRVFFHISSVNINGRKKYVGKVERHLSSGKTISSGCSLDNGTAVFDDMRDIMLAGVYTALTRLMVSKKKGMVPGCSGVLN